MDLIFAAFNRAVEEGKGGGSAAEEAANKARKQKVVEAVEVTPGGEGLELTVAAPPVEGRKPKTCIWFANRRAPLTTPVPREAPPSALASHPNTHINAANPAGDPDAPASRTALLVSRFTSQPYFSFKKEVWKEGDTAPHPLASAARTTTFEDCGDDLNANAALLEKAGYQTTVLIDDKATPGAVFRALQAWPGGIYFGTHGGDHLDRAGIAVGGHLGTTDEPWDVRTRRLREMLMREGVPGPAAAAVTVGCMGGSRGRAFCFPLLWPRFIEVALGGQGAPDSFVFLDACHSAKNPSLARAFRAKAFL